MPEGIEPGQYRSIQFCIDSIEIINPLYRQATETYEGSLQYSLQILGIQDRDTIILESANDQMNMVLQMCYKEFGEKSLLIWEVFLSIDR